MAEPSLRRAFWQGYGVGLAACVAWPLVLQLLIGPVLRVPPPLLQGEDLRQVGFTLTGLACLSSAVIWWRARSLRRTLAGLPPPARPVRVRGELLLASGLIALSVVLGLAYLALGGAEALRYVRGFLLLAPFQFLALVPRLAAWESAGA